jgi:glycerate 2-kinase
VTSELFIDALEIANAWRAGLQLGELIADGLNRTEVVDMAVDVVAIGKASREMANACHAVLGDHVRRILIVTDEEWDPAFNAEVVIGSHPLVSDASIAAGERLVAFLGEPTSATSTVFLVSGGASSLCALPLQPLTVSDLSSLWDAAVEAGLNITTLNQLRAATSGIAGGMVLRYVRTPLSTSLIMVDNVVSGEEWVASGLTYDFRPSPDELAALVDQLNRPGSPLVDRLLRAAAHRRTLTSEPIATAHQNVVIAQPSLVLQRASNAASRLGYRVVDLGSAVHGDVADVAKLYESVIDDETRRGGSFCVLSVGEVTVRVTGSGRGGRCQELAWLMAPRLANLGRGAFFAAVATDGRDFVDGVGGAWVDQTTMATLAKMSISWDDIARSNDSFRGLSLLDQLLAGGRTGWNLCDLYLAIVR